MERKKELQHVINAIKNDEYIDFEKYLYPPN